MSFNEIVSTLDTCCAEAIKNLRTTWANSATRRAIHTLSTKEQRHESDR